MKVGPVATEQLSRFGREWKQGEHVLITGPTGSGKTTIARHVVEQRVQRRGFVVVFVGKLQPDETLDREYAGWTRWEKWKDRPRLHENRILLQPKTKGMSIRDARLHQREVFGEAMDSLSRTGRWTLQVDEGLYTCSPQFLNLADPLAMLHSLGRSSDLTIVTLAQRPAHLPLIIYSSASHAWVGRARELADRKRLSELGGLESAQELERKMAGQGRRDFLWVPVAPDWPAEKFNITH